MSLEINKLRFVGVYVEPDGSYQVSAGGDPGDFTPFVYQEGTLDAKGAVQLLDPMTGKMLLDGHDLQVIGPKSNTVNIGCVVHSHGRDLVGNVTTPTEGGFALLAVLKAIMGGSVAAGEEASATTVQGASTTTVVNVSAGHGDRFTAGLPIGVETVSGSSRLEVREIASISTDALTLKEALSAAPVIGTQVRGGVTCYLTEDPKTSLQWLIEGREANDAVEYRGTQGGFSLQLPLGGLGMFSFALTGAGWDRLGTSQVTIPDYGLFRPIALNPIILHVPTVGSTVRREIDESAITIEPQITYAPVRSGNAEETIKRMRRQAARGVVKGSFTAPLEDETWFDARDNRTAMSVYVQCGVLAGGILFISIPTVQIVDVQPAPSESDISGQIVSWVARHDQTLIGDATNPLLASAIRATFM